MIEEIPLELWEDIFRSGWLKVEDMVHLSGLSRNLHYLMHHITAFRKMTFSPLDEFPSNRTVKNLEQVRGWPNVSFLRDIFFSKNYKNIQNLYFFHTWKEFDNVYFSLHIGFGEAGTDIPDSIQKRVYHIEVCDTQYYPYEWTPYVSYTNIEDCRAMKKEKIRKGMVFRYSDIYDLTPLSNLEEVKFVFCEEIVDISPLRNIKKVVIKSCDFLVDVSPLTGCDHVDLTACGGVNDFRSLGDVKVLILSQTRINDLTFLKRTKELDISNCKRINHISCLSELEGLEKLNISNNDQITEITPPSTLKILCMKRTGIVDVNSLGGLTKINMRFCPVEDVSPLKDVQELDVSYCSKIKDFSVLDSVKKLTLTISKRE